MRRADELARTFTDDYLATLHAEYATLNETGSLPADAQLPQFAATCWPPAANGVTLIFAHHAVASELADRYLAVVARNR